MLNYIWISLVAIAILTAVGNDIRDEVRNTYRNGIPNEAEFLVQKPPFENSHAWGGQLVLSGKEFDRFYGVTSTWQEVRLPATMVLSQGQDGSLSLPVTDNTPDIWKEMAKSASARDRLTGRVLSVSFSQDRSSAKIQFLLEPIRYVKIKAVTQAALDFANTAVELSIGLIGIMALWLGLMKIAEEAGFIAIVTKLLTPLTKRLFPDVPPNHPAVGAMMMNIAANMLGLNNAATPLGLKAMEELNNINPKVGTATNAMITFLTINTGGLVLIPATAIAVRAASGSANPGIIIGTSIVGATCATVAGVLAARLLQRLPRYRKDFEARRG